MSVMERKQIYMVAIYTKRKKCHIAFQFTKSYVLQANEKELFKTYPKLTKKYPVFSTEIYRRQFKIYPVHQLLFFTGGSANFNQTLNWNITGCSVPFLKN